MGMIIAATALVLLIYKAKHKYVAHVFSALQ